MHRGKVKVLGGAQTLPRSHSVCIEESPDEHRRFRKFNNPAPIVHRACNEAFYGYDTLEGREVSWNCVRKAGRSERDMHEIAQSLDVLTRLHHDHILRVHGSWVRPESGDVVFVTSTMSTLADFIARAGAMRWKVVRRWCLHILQALEYMHKQEIPVVHRRISCASMFVSEGGGVCVGGVGDVCLASRGRGALTSVSSEGDAAAGVGGAEAAAAADASVGPEGAVFGFGICLVEMLTRSRPPQCVVESPELLDDLVDALCCPREVKDFIFLALAPLEQRPTATDLLDSPLLCGRDSRIDDKIVSRPPSLNPKARAALARAAAAAAATVGAANGGSGDGGGGVGVSPSADDTVTLEGRLLRKRGSEEQLWNMLPSDESQCKTRSHTCSAGDPEYV